MSGPSPPADLASRRPETIKLTAGSIFHRFSTANKDPVFFDRSRNGRFNAPDGSYGVLYTAREDYGAFAETFLRRPGADSDRRPAIGSQGVRPPRVRSELTLIKFAGSGLARLGAAAEVVHGGLPYDVPQEWSKALVAHPAQAHGIAYYARHDDEALCYAIHDRTAVDLIEIDRRTDLDQDWFWRLARRYGAGMAPG